MKLLKQLIESFISQGPVGFTFLAITIGAGIYCCIDSFKIKKQYRNLTEEFKNSEKITIDGNEELDIKNEVLDLIVKDFKNSASRGTENINTEVIIQKRLDENISIFKKERRVKSIPAICIALGLLGTFLGLTLAIIQTKGVLGDSLGSTHMFGQAMEEPFTSMSSAFWTSIVGVATSAILNYCNINLENSKEEFYDVIEDYLDNTIYSLYAVNLISQFNEFNNIIRESMLTLTGEMKNLFQDGVSELVGKINKNTIDLTETVKELTNYTKDLERLTSSLDASVKNFKEPVDNFKSSMHEFIQTTEDTNSIMKESVNKFSSKVDMLESSFIGVEDVIRANKVALDSIGNNINSNLNEGIKTINNSHEMFRKLTEEISINQNNNQEVLKEQIEKLNKGYDNFNGSLLGFVENLSATQSNLANEISNSLTTEFKNLSSEIVENLNVTVSKLGQSAEELKSNTNDIGNLVKQTNDLYRATNIEKEPVNA